MERVIHILPHQRAGVMTGAEGYSAEQSRLITTLSRLPMTRFDTTQGKSVICDICPLNPESSSFDPDIGICDKNDPGLKATDEEYG